MADVIYALSQKRSRLFERKRSIQQEAERQIREIDSEIETIDMAVKTLNDAISDYLCPDCRGTGNVRKYDAAGQMEDVVCPRCRGIGFSVK